MIEDPDIEAEMSTLCDDIPQAKQSSGMLVDERSLMLTKMLKCADIPDLEEFGKLEPMPVTVKVAKDGSEAEERKEINEKVKAFIQI